MKKITVLILSCFIVLSPLFNIGDFSYADTQPSWIYVTQQDDEPERTAVVGAIKAYLNARGYQNIFTYTAEKAVVQWSYNNWDNFARSKGYNGLSDLNNHIAYRYNSNGVLQFFLDGSSLEMMNQIYTAILEYYNISENTNKQIYNGEWFEDDDGNGCYVYYSSTSGTSNTPITDYNRYISKEGTKYRFTGLQLYSINGNNSKRYEINYNKSTSYYYYNYTTIGNVNYCSIDSQSPSSVSLARVIYFPVNSELTYKEGFLAIFKYNNRYYLGSFIDYISKQSNTNYFALSCTLLLNSTDINDAAISAAQAGMNAGIVAAGKAAAITTGKEGINALKDYIEDNDSGDDDIVTPIDDPTTPPDDIPSGGNPPEYNDTGGVLTPDGNGGFNFNFKMPQFNINWNLELNTNNLPFPFSIPSDFYKAFQAIDVEPEAPSFSKVIHLGFGNRWSYNWNFECDLSEIDGAETLANIHRKWFLFVYIVMLIIATRSVMHIY